MACLKTLLLLAIISFVNAQYGYNFNPIKPGSCPPPLPVGICTRSCFGDENCLGIGKCCYTSCGGTVCSQPVTTRKLENLEKPGFCPAVPNGRWVCSSTCSTDSDCRGTKKCCKNRCGGFACQKPEVEVIESIEVPFGVNPEILEGNLQPNRNPFLVDSN